MDPKFNNLVGVEESAIKILKRAIDLDQKKNLQSALTCYQEGIDLLLEVLKGSTDQQKKIALRKRIESYMNQAEKIKATILRQKEEGKYHVQINIQDNDVGFGYQRIFSPYLGEEVTEIWVVDAYIRGYHQICNFLRFCELSISQCPNLSKVNLNTSCGAQNNDQITNLSNLKENLRTKNNIELNLNFSDVLHDREIRFNNGWIIKIGRGLDYFKRTDKLTVGFFDLNQRKCLQTSIDIFHNSKTNYT